MKHSEGPWIVTPGVCNCACNGCYGDVESADGYSVATVWADVEDLEPFAVGNAHLIAAAPDLLAACKLAVKSWFSGEVSEAEMDRVLRIAIAKAEGRDQ